MIPSYRKEFDSKILAATKLAELQIAGMKAETLEITRKITHLKYVVVTTAVASVLGLYAANTATMQALLAAYDSGKIYATQIAHITDRLDRIVERMDARDALEASSTKSNNRLLNR